MRLIAFAANSALLLYWAYQVFDRGVPALDSERFLPMLLILAAPVISIVALIDWREKIGPASEKTTLELARLAIRAKLTKVAETK